jgi:putative membrane protein
MHAISIPKPCIAVLAIVGSVAASEAEPPTSVQAGSTQTDAELIAILGAADEFQRRAAHMAIERSQRAQVRELAQVLLRSHARRIEQFVSAASQAGLEPPLALLDAALSDKLSELGAIAPELFDERWLRDQIDAHERARALMMQCMDRCMAEPVRASAAEAIRDIERDLRNCYAVKQALKASAGQPTGAR